jgi:hypothetical protein
MRRTNVLSTTGPSIALVHGVLTDASVWNAVTRRRIASWAHSTRDLSLPQAILRFMAERAGSRTVEVESSHAAPVAQPAAVTNLILEAHCAVSPSTDTVTR